MTPTRLGEELLLTSAPGSELATRVAANSRPYAEKFAHLRGLPYGRVDIRLTEYPGQLVIEVREKDPSVNGPVTHPALDADSPYADWFPEPASIRDPVPIGVIPETGEPMELVLWDQEGGKAVGVYSMTGGGKTNMLDVLRERITAMDDAILVQLNAAGSGDELSWEPLAAVTAAGLQAGNPDLRGRIIGALQWARHLIGERAETAAHTGDSVFQPTRQDPAVVVMIDEIDETGNIEGATKLLEFLASKQRKSAVCLVLAGQRATVQWTGGSGVRVNLSTVVYGMLARDSEARHAVGAENELPDISEYSRGQAGYFGIYSVRQKKLTQRGRTFYIGKLRDQQEKIIARRDPAARPALKGAGEVTAPAPAAPREQPGSGLRERLAHVRELNEGHPSPARGSAPGGPRGAPGGRGGPGPGAGSGARSRPRRPGWPWACPSPPRTGTSRRCMRPGWSRWPRRRPVRRVAARRPGCRPSALEPASTPRSRTSPRPCTTAWCEADDEQREVLEQVWQIAHRPRLTLACVPGSGGRRTVTRNSSRESSRESSRKRSTGCATRDGLGRFGTIPPRSRARPL